MRRLSFTPVEISVAASGSDRSCNSQTVIGTSEMEGGPRCECPPPYLLSLQGILKIVEIVSALLTFACSFSWGFVGAGYVEVAGITAFVTITVWLIFHLMNFIPELLVNYLVELVGYIVMGLFLFIAGIVAAAGASRLQIGSIGAASFFAFASAIVCGIDVTLQIMARRQVMVQSSQQTTNSTTTSTTSSDVNLEY